MALKIDAIIGANYGDEGKGRTVDLLASLALNKPLIVRHNSGAQAGHTVVRNGIRHVFSHFGSATILGAPTFLGPKFVINPLLFNVEWDELEAQGIKPNVTVDGRCMVTNPFDVLINRVRELARGSERHGSCGAGFGETIARYEELGDRTRSVLDEALASDKRPLEIADALFARANAVSLITQPQFDRLYDSYVFQLDLMLQRIAGFARLEDQLAAKVTDHLIFEGAQGLELHQDHPNFPHVTRSRTGLEDVVELLGMSGVVDGELNAYYCTRSYVTRHGAGPLENELTREQFEDLGYVIDDETNIDNQHQGSLRFAELDARQLMQRTSTDRLRARQINPSMELRKNYTITHLERCPDETWKSLVIGIIDNPTSFYTGYGPEAKDTIRGGNKREVVPVSVPS
jgi:adenylosuccinate synthase